MAGEFEIGSFRLDPDVGVLTTNGRPTALGRRAVAVLAELVDHANEYVPKERLLEAGWPNAVVEEGNLPVQIAAIRRVLAGSGGEHWIETLPRRGYRFVGPVKMLTDQRPTASSIPRSNLPAALTSFIGRERELVEIKRLLPGKRLLTIQGAGGIGKTRLALQVAAEVVDAYRDGAWLAELGAIRDPTLVSTTIAQLLGLPEKANTLPTDKLCAHLESRQVLLVLDNCEHLIDACARLVEAVLRHAQDVTILTTSREPLRLPGEQSYVLQPLSLPDAGSQDDIRNAEAVQLFVERVQRQLPDFTLTPDRARVVAEICIHLDGIPLALELAAARARSLSLEQINTRLGDRFHLLTSGSRVALPRQQTLRATLDWSYDLLSEEERIVLRRMSVFPGSFTMEAASAVAADERIDDYAVIDLVSQLVSRSLLTADTATIGTRYRMLETTCAYAFEKLSETGETEACKRRHAQFFREFFEPALDERFRNATAAWRAKYVPEIDNVRVALGWALAEPTASPIGIALAGSSAELWGMLGLFGEGVRRMRAAIAHIGPETPEREQARLWLWLGRLVDEGPADACPAFERAAEHYRQIGDALGLGHVLVRLGRVLGFMGKIEQAERTLDEAHSLLKDSAPPRLLSLYFSHVAFLKTFVGDLAGARTHYERALDLDRQAEDEFGTLAIIGNLANVTWALGDLDAAAAATRKQVALLRDSPVSTRRLLGYALSNLAGVLTERGDLDDALAVAAEGLPLVGEDGSAWVFADHVALRAALAGRVSDAARIAGYARHVWGIKNATRQPNEARACNRLHALLRERLPADEVERLLAEGAKLTDDEACRLALEE